ncbi:MULTISPECIES: pentapeptide repeat-containing protein [unclassified Streptomyces]|uniref:pentapeptide repeat-containing protein n=1 Tax=unclassified Streptomyces TaxID=2593676 RepID=UPI000DC7A05F|nr:MULTISPECIES: pentapeptide repeat-containing protein [unclassified Streptomyces]AWZ10635.1 pentapeptide repeat-containing protein [Streptomyces sp. ICC4]AWZ18347.1 pentapeptide repeat-containing protein [Streptomyces sp. ICC1]
MTSPPAPPPGTPVWPHCGEGASPADPVGCRGRQVAVPLTAGPPRCLAHLAPADLTLHLASLSAGDDVEHQGVTFTGNLADRLFDALRDPATGRPRFGRATFDHAVFASEARFDGATFSSVADFGGAEFGALAWFDNVTFQAEAWFSGAVFRDGARFVGTVFHTDVRFGSLTISVAVRSGSAVANLTTTVQVDGVTFEAGAWFSGAVFHAEAQFDEVVFPDEVRFHGTAFQSKARFVGATFHTDAWFKRASFAGAVLFDGAVLHADGLFEDASFSTAHRLGPLACHGSLDLSGAAFGRAVTIEAAARSLTCARAVWESTATLRLRYADVDLSDAVVTQPIAVTAHAAPFAHLDESCLGNADDRVRVLSLRGIDAAQLVLTGTDLSACRFLGAFHLDQLRLGGDTVFARTPAGTDLRRLVPLRWTDRLALAEEHHWRALPHHRRRMRAGWVPDAPPTVTSAPPPGPAALAALYRQLRKGFEDGRDEPGAADFYYAEMEMRRLERRSPRSRAERGLLTAYWALSGYGLRASRALAWLGLAMTATVLVMMVWGLPQNDPKSVSAGRVVGQNVRLTTDTPDPVNPSGPLHERLTAKRFEKSLRVVVNSVVFRSSGQNLTTPGTYVEMASRLTEPVLLGFAALAVRGRVKR